MRTITTLLLVGLLAACGQGEGPGAAAGGSGTANVPAEASYGRRLFFVAGSSNGPTAAVFDFSMVTTRASIERSTRAWLGHDTGWNRLLDTTWSDSTIREPWRLVPHGPLRLVVDDAGELESLLLRADSAVRLRTMPALAEWSPSDAMRVRVRRAGLARAETQQVEGILLDVQEGEPGPPDSEPGGIFLTDGSDLFLLVAGWQGQQTPAWLRSGTREEIFDSVTITPLPADSTRPAGTEAWRVSGPAEFFTGEVHVMGVPLATTDTPASGATVRVVRGWIEVRGDRREVFGMARRGRE